MANRKGYKRYYQVARDGSQNLATPVMRELIKGAKSKRRILDLGCGDGTRLSLVAKSKKAIGIDESDFAIKEGKRRYHNLRFVKGSVGKLPFDDESFDFVYSAFVLEHLKKPERMLKEAIRVLEKGGTIFLAAPNYGAPNRQSPCSTENKYLKLFKGLVNDFLVLVRPVESISWKKVEPRLKEPYEIDFDTEIEPYALSLIKYLKGKKMNLVRISTFWEIQEENKSFLFRTIRALGKKRISPFKYWGPQLLVVAQKIDG